MKLRTIKFVKDLEDVIHEEVVEKFGFVNIEFYTKPISKNTQYQVAICPSSCDDFVHLKVYFGENEDFPVAMNENYSVFERILKFIPFNSFEIIRSKEINKFKNSVEEEEVFI